jgi:hypothetical protein
MQKENDRNDINIVGLIISRKTDIIAITAFLISIVGRTYQVTIFLSGPKLEFFPPEKILFCFDRNDDKTLMVNARITYVNKGKLGHDAIIKKEIVKFKFNKDGPVYNLEWINFESANYDKEKDDLAWTFNSDAKPLSVRAGSAESHFTTFGPFQNPDSTNDRQKYRNFIPKSLFIHKIKQKSFSELNLEFEVEFYGEDSLKGDCVIDLDKTRDDFLTVLGEEEKDKEYIQISCSKNLN